MLPTKRPLEDQADDDGEEMSSNPVDIEIDEVLHGRQLAVYGRETMQKFSASNVLVSGLQGLGAEIAKNVILAGLKSVTLHDEQLVEMWDLSSSFVLSEDDVGNNRALASFEKLQELNPSVKVNILTTQITKQDLSRFQVVVFTDISLEKAKELDGFCHHHQPPIAFINTQVRGLFGSVFCDFGPHFTVVDVDGEEPQTGIIASISNGNPALITCARSEKLEFQDGDVVVFSRVQGMTELNDGKTRKINNVRHKSFALNGETWKKTNQRHDSWHNSFTLEEDTTKYGVYKEGGIVTQVKQPKKLHFKPLSEALGDFLLSDFSTSDRPPLLHLAFQALDKFRAELGRFPVAGSEDDAQKLISIFSSINNSCADDAKIEEIDQNLLRCFAFGAKAVLNPMAAMFGGIVGQEVLKACSGKFHPLFQFFYFDSVESLPTKHPSADDVRPQNSRYDAQISVFGSKFQKKLEKAQVFIVGAGALGCEFLKNVALMGVSCGDHGKVAITDDDVIEKSNLSTQFLFRDCNVGQAKSVVAANAARSINPLFHVKALQNRASSETENVFDDRFWGDLNVAINALDNVESRVYIDERCVTFGKPLLECGTLGAKCSTQMVIPRLSENYGASRDPPEKLYSMERFTPPPYSYNIDHCVGWALSELEVLILTTPSEVNEILENPGECIAFLKDDGSYEARGMLESVVECLVDKPQTFTDCIKWARLKFEDYFVHRIKQLTITYPREALTSHKEPFWSAPRRFPRPLEFSGNDSSHLEFVMVAAKLRAETFGIPTSDWIKSPQKLAEVVGGVIVPEFKPKVVDQVIGLFPHQISAALIANDIKVIDELIHKLTDTISQLPQGFILKPVQLHMDDENNYQIQMIVGLANMSARNFDIPEVDKLKAKLIAGRVVPAIATSTAMATGLVCLELYKVLDEEHKLQDYRNAFANLALPLFLMAEPVPPEVVNHRSMSWTVWDHWMLKGNPTLKELLDWLQEKKGITVSAIKYEGRHLYHSMNPKRKESFEKNVVDLINEKPNADLPLHRKYFDLKVVSESVKIPRVSVWA